VLCDALGNPTSFYLTGGHAHDLAGADALLPDLKAKALLADKAYHAQKRVIEPLEARGITIVIPPKRNHKNPRAYDKHLYKARHLVENFFCKLKRFRSIATRYDKTKTIFHAALYAAAIVIISN
jgi:transposase